MITTERIKTDAIDMRMINIEDDEIARVMMTGEDAVQEHPIDVSVITRQISTGNRNRPKMLKEKVLKFSHRPKNPHRRRVHHLLKYQIFKRRQCHRPKMQLYLRIIIPKL